MRAGGQPFDPGPFDIWADGLGLVIDRLHERLATTPLLVVEYGIGTFDDGLRADYLRRGPEITNQAIERGVDIRGFFHWTAVDNYEWLHSYDVSFGLIDCPGRAPERNGDRRTNVELSGVPRAVNLPFAWRCVTWQRFGGSEVSVSTFVLPHRS